jgi:hypothetical protein
VRRNPPSIPFLMRPLISMPESVPATPAVRSRATSPLALIAYALAVYLLLGLVAAPLAASALGADAAVAKALAQVRASLWDGSLILVALAAVVPAFAALQPSRVGGWMRPASAEALGAIRAWIAAILLASVLWEDLASSAYLPRGMHTPDRQWLISLLHALPIHFDGFLASWTALQAFETATVLLLAMAMLGLFTRWTVPAGALAYLLFAALLRSYAWGYHTGVIPLYSLLLLAFTPCGDAFSLDRRLRARRGLPVEPARTPRLRYAVGRYLVWMSIAIPYTLAGLSKVRNSSLMWWDGEHMKQMLVATVLEPMHFDFQLTYRLIQGPGWLFDALGLAALLGEITFVLVLVSVLARRVLPLVMAGMHVGILMMQNILFPDLIAIQAVFYDWTPLRERAVAWAGRMRGAFGRIAEPRLALAPALAGAPASAIDGDARPIAAAGVGGGSGASGEGGRTGDAARGMDPWVRRQAIVACAFLLVGFGCWASRTENFPFTAMQMFSRQQALEPVTYVRPMVVYENGARERARFEEWIGAMADTRYRRLIRDGTQKPEKEALLREFLDAAARQANAAPAPGRRVRRFELETRRWDFRAHPADPARGELLSVFMHDVAAPR